MVQSKFCISLQSEHLKVLYTVPVCTHTHTHTHRTACALQHFGNVALLNVTFSLLDLFPFFSHLVTTIYRKYIHCTINNGISNSWQKRNSSSITFDIQPDSHLLLLRSTHLYHKDGSTEDRSLNLSRNTNKMPRHSTLFPVLSLFSTCFGHVPCPSSDQ
jgi:hypothetical protein